MMDPRPGAQVRDYELVELLGEGGLGATWRVKHVRSGEHYALKLMHLSRVGDWKAVELFEREAAVLRSIEHPAVPAYVDAFPLEEGLSMALVQGLAPGESLDARVRRCGPLDVAGFERLADELLEVLVYLQAMQPPVVHRDIKPQNVLVDESGAARLVDFGAVCVSASVGLQGGGSTVVGTFGYMAPEQFRGVASAATDLYGLGATLLYALTGKHPTDFEKVRMELQFDDAVDLPPRLDAWLKRMLAPASEDRFPNAAEAREALGGGPAEDPDAPRTASAEEAERSPRALRRLGGVDLLFSDDGLILHWTTEHWVNSLTWVAAGQICLLFVTAPLTKHLAPAFGLDPGGRIVSIAFLVHVLAGLAILMHVRTRTETITLTRGGAEWRVRSAVRSAVYREPLEMLFVYTGILWREKSDITYGVTIELSSFDSVKRRRVPMGPTDAETFSSIIQAEKARLRGAGAVGEAGAPTVTEVASEVSALAAHESA